MGNPCYLAAEITWMWYTSLPSAALRPVACTPATSEVITSRVSTAFRISLLPSAALFRASRTGTRLSWNSSGATCPGAFMDSLMTSMPKAFGMLMAQRVSETLTTGFRSAPSGHS